MGRIIAAWLGCACLLPAHAQYHIDHWTADNGLPQNSVRDIVRTRDGYLWLTTFDGLVRFDGVRFTVFKKSNSTNILTNRFMLLSEDARGNLWASTEDGGLVRQQAGWFTAYPPGQGRLGNFIQGMGGDGLGKLLVFVGGKPLHWMEDQFQPVSDERLPLTSATSEAGLRLPCNISLKGKATCVIAGELLTLPAFTFLEGNFPVQDRSGVVWGVAQEGIIKIEPGRVPQMYMLREELPGKEAKLVYGQEPRKIFARADDGSLWLTTLETRQHQRVTTQVPENLVMQVAYEDPEGNYWIGTNKEGLYRLRKQSVTAYGKAEGLPAEEVYPILEDRKGTIWMGTIEAGLQRFENGVFTRIKSHANLITSLYEDRAGDLWVNVNREFITNRSARPLHLGRLPAPSGFIWTVYEDLAGGFWMGAEKGVALYRNGEAKLFTTQDGLAGNDTKVIIADGVDGKDGLWIGSYGGLTHYQNGQFQAWTERDGLPSNTVRALKQDRDSTLWIGTYDGGLGRFKDGQFTRYTMRDGLFDNGVFQILEDDYGWMWMSCNRGIYRVRKQELIDFAEGKSKTITSIAYGKSEGMRNAECNGGRWPAGVKARDGKLWFPTMGGVVMIDPSALHLNAHPPPVVIEAMRIDNKAVPLELWASAMSNPTSAISIQPGQANFEIEYTALSFINSDHLRFKYKLEGLDADWIDAGTRRTAYFSHVAPGHYTFKVIAANSDGIWNTEGKSLRIRVLPPFYRTWWFLSLAALLVGGVFFAAFQYRITQLERRRAAQETFARQLIESQEAERKRLAAELHDSLGQHLLVIKNRAMLGEQTTTDASPAREQFDEITAAATQAISEVRAISHNLRPVNLERLGLTAVIEEMIERVAGGEPDLQFSLDIEPIDGLLSKEGEINLFRILQESTNNILKHAQATKAYLEIWREGAELRVTMRDNGRGYDPATTPQRGLGLTSISERVRMLGGTRTVTTAPGAGTKIELWIPLNS
ncbi:MAG TPA: two-component regulator propeller domain-containing protein [Blastocatellia bacterium]|nr:two-component regulator propeller domain-containing protein [Blastocatellia bacterium]